MSRWAGCITCGTEISDEMKSWPYCEKCGGDSESNDEVAVFDLSHVSTLLVRAFTLLEACENADKAMLPEEVAQASADFRSVYEELNQLP